MGQGTTTVPAWHALPSVHQDSSGKQAQWLQQSTNVGCAECLIVVLVGLPLPLQPLHTCCRQVNLYRGLFAVAASVEHNNTLFAACIRESVHGSKESACEVTVYHSSRNQGMCPCV